MLGKFAFALMGLAGACLLSWAVLRAQPLPAQPPGAPESVPGKLPVMTQEAGTPPPPAVPAPLPGALPVAPLPGNVTPVSAGVQELPSGPPPVPPPQVPARQEPPIAEQPANKVTAPLPGAVSPPSGPPEAPPGIGQPFPPAAVTPNRPTPPSAPQPQPQQAEAVPSKSAFPPAEERPELSVTAENPAGRQEAAVSIEWGGSPVAKVGQTGEYSLVVRNACNIPVQQVVVRARVPAGLTLQNCEPKATAESGMQVWELGTLLARQERILTMRIRADVKGEATPQAWVTFTGSSAMRIRVREPKLLVKCQTPEKVLVGDPAQLTLAVSNPGDGSADQVKIRAILSEGLEHARGNKIDFEIGSLAAGESRNVTLLCATRAGGQARCEVTAEADSGLVAKDTGTLLVTMPKLDIQVIGPALRYLDRKAIYTLRVTNPGDAPATNVTVADVVPPGFRVLAASDGGRHEYQTRTVSWFLGEIQPGQTREVRVEVQAINPGDHKHRATAVGARGLRAEGELVTKVEGLSALLLEMVDTEDPIEVGGDTAYEVRITNTGSKTETNIKLVATIPEKMQFKNAGGPVRYREEGQTVIFEPIERLAPRADAIFRINVRAQQAGTVRFQIRVTSTNLTEPVIKMEATRIYSDTPDGATAVGARPETPPRPPVPTPSAPLPPATGAIMAPIPGSAPQER